jgi:hypothetical protein
LLGSILAVSCFANDRGQPQAQVFLQRIVAVDGESSYPDPLVFTSLKIPESLLDAGQRLMEAVPTEFTASSKTQAARVCAFVSPSDWKHDFEKCAELVCTSLPVGSQDRGCGYLVKVNEWVEEHWLGGLCRTSITNRKESALVRWLSAKNITQCYQMSELITVAFFRYATGLPVNESGLIEALPD